VEASFIRMARMPIFASMATSPSLSAPADVRSTEVPGLGLAVRLRGRKVRGQAVPLVLHFHGGAFTSGSPECGDCMAELLADSGAVVASLAYPLAPQHRFPDAVEAGYATLEWLYRERARLAGKGAPVFVAGEEAGGNLAAAVSLIARDRLHPPLAGQVLVAPMLDPCNATASLRETLGEVTVCKWTQGWQQYLRGPMDAEHPYAVPAHAQRLTGLPPALILTGGDDPMRDEALAYAQRLRDAGIAVTSELLPPTTGWPDTLGAASAEAGACGLEVQRYLRAFFNGAMPPAS
jgi:acetyl esterase